MISLVDYIFSNVEYLISLMTDSKVASAIGANFFYIILSLWVFWLMINFFLLRPMPGGNLVDKAQSWSRREAAAERREARAARHSSRSDETQEES